MASHYSREEIAAAVDEAHALGHRLTVDSETIYTEWAVEAGVDAIEHPLPRTDEVIAMMAARGIASVPTVVPYDYIIEWMDSYHSSTSRRFELTGETTRAMLRKMREAGVLIGLGTDLVFDWFRDLPYVYIEELEIYLECGFTPTEALLAATRDNARILGMEDKLGTLERGKLADILVVKGNPLEGFDALLNVAHVFRDGLLGSPRRRHPTDPPEASSPRGRITPPAAGPQPPGRHRVRRAPADPRPAVAADHAPVETARCYVPARRTRQGPPTSGRHRAVARNQRR